MDKPYLCFSLKLAGYLMQRGFVLFEANKDQKTDRFIYVFKNSDSLRSAVNDYKNNK